VHRGRTQASKAKGEEHPEGLLGVGHELESAPPLPSPCPGFGPWPGPGPGSVWPPPGALPGVPPATGLAGRASWSWLANCRPQRFLGVPGSLSWGQQGEGADVVMHKLSTCPLRLSRVGSGEGENGLKRRGGWAQRKMEMGSRGCERAERSDLAQEEVQLRSPSSGGLQVPGSSCRSRW